MDLRVDLQLPEGTPDLTVVCDSQAFQVCRKLLISKSKVFDQYCLPCVTCVEITPTRMPLSADLLTTRGRTTQYISAEINAGIFHTVVEFLHTGEIEVITQSTSHCAEEEDERDSALALKFSVCAADVSLEIYLAAEVLQMTELKAYAASRFDSAFTQAFTFQRVPAHVANIAIRAYDKLEPNSQIERTLLDLCSRNPTKLIAHTQLHDLMKSKYAAAWDLIGDVNHYLHARAKLQEEHSRPTNDELRNELAQLQKELDESRSTTSRSEARAVELQTRLDAEVNAEREVSEKIEAELADEQAERRRLQTALLEAEATVQTFKQRELVGSQEKEKIIAGEKAEKACLQDAFSAAEERIRSLQEQESEGLRQKGKQIQRLEQELNQAYQKLTEAQCEINSRREIPSPLPSNGLDKQTWISQSSVLRGILDEIDAAVHTDNASQLTSSLSLAMKLESKAEGSTRDALTPTRNRAVQTLNVQDWSTPPYSSARSKKTQDDSISASSGLDSAPNPTKSRLSVTAKEFQPGVFGNVTNRLRYSKHGTEKVNDWYDGASTDRSKNEDSAVLIDF